MDVKWNILKKNLDFVRLHIVSILKKKDIKLNRMSKFSLKDSYPLREARLKYQCTLTSVAKDLGVSISCLSRTEQRPVGEIKHYIVEYYKKNFGYSE